MNRVVYKLVPEKKAGFTLIELLVATAIASTLVIALFSTLSQTQRSVKRVDSMVNVSMRAIVGMHQLERDLAGAFVPVEGKRKKQETQKKEAAEKIDAQAKVEKGKAKKINKVFFGSVNNEMLDTLTFITNNPTMDPVCVNRVVYKLVPEKKAKNQPDSFALMRQESTQLNLEVFGGGGEKPIRSYEMMGGIKKLTVTYTAALVKEKVERKGNQETKTIETEYKVYNDWNMEEEIKQPIKQDQLRRKLIPYAIDINFTLWDDQKKREKSFTLKTVILPDHDEFEPEQKAQAKPAVPALPTPQITPQMPQPNIRQALNGKNPRTPQKPKSAFDKIPSVINTLLGVRSPKATQGAA